MPRYRLLVALHRRADLRLPYALPACPSVLEEAEIVRSVAAVLEVGVLVASIFVLADLYVFYPYSEGVVDVLRTLSVRLLALKKLVLRAVGVIRRAVGKKIARLVVGIVCSSVVVYTISYSLGITTSCKSKASLTITILPSNR